MLAFSNRICTGAGIVREERITPATYFKSGNVILM